MCLSTQLEPTSFADAVESPEKEAWNKAMEEELASLEKNQTWELTPKPEGVNVISSKWVYKLKKDTEGNVLRYKEDLLRAGSHKSTAWIMLILMHQRDG